jgi:hypothetical protein
MDQHAVGREHRLWSNYGDMANGSVKDQDVCPRIQRLRRDDMITTAWEWLQRVWTCEWKEMGSLLRAGYVGYRIPTGGYMGLGYGRRWASLRIVYVNHMYPSKVCPFRRWGVPKHASCCKCRRCCLLK